MTVDLLSGKLIDEKYAILEQIGSGGFGIAYKAMHEALDRVVVIKVCHGNDFQTEHLHRIRREAIATRSVQHARVVQVYDHGFLPDGRPYTVFEYVPGVTLSELIEQREHLSTREVNDLFKQIASGLRAIHAAELSHRDVTSKNILVVADPQNEKLDAKIIDFGLVKPAGEWAKSTLALTKSGFAVGSPAYMSPEQCMSQTIDGRSDIYSLGCVMYEAWTGVLPFPYDTDFQVMQAHVYEKPNLNMLASDDAAERRLAQVILKSLEKNASDRYQDCEELLNDLCGTAPIDWSSGKEALTSAPTGKRGSKNPIHTTRWKHFRNALKPIALTLVAGLVALVLVITVRNCQKHGYTTAPLSDDMPSSPLLWAAIEKVAILKKADNQLRSASSMSDNDAQVLSRRVDTLIRQFPTRPRWKVDNFDDYDTDRGRLIGLYLEAMALNSELKLDFAARDRYFLRAVDMYHRVRLDSRDLIIDWGYCLRRHGNTARAQALMAAEQALQTRRSTWSGDDAFAAYSQGQWPLLIGHSRDHDPALSKAKYNLF